MPLNPNSARDYLNGFSSKSLSDQVDDFPNFFMELRLIAFRHIRNLTLTFKHPISVISGNNRSGKTTALMAVACSHYNFMRPNVNNGNLERATWSKVVRFTSQDVQGSPWSYQVRYRTGTQVHTNAGSKNETSNKWSGVAKKSGQIGRPTTGHPGGGRTVVLIDLNRINPSRHLSPSFFGKVRRLPGGPFSDQTKVNQYLSYIFEDNYNVEQIASVADSKIYKFTNASNYSSYNTASGEDAVVSILCQILGAPNNSLILIDEIEVGLHPKIQRKLMEVLFMISKDEHKQFIITSHAYAIIDSVPLESRLFIANNSGTFRCLQGLTTYETLTRMDCEAFPVITVYVEDDVSKAILMCAITEINKQNPGFARLVNVVIVGSADRTFNYFVTRKAVKSDEPYSSRPACVLDGDMQQNRNGDGVLNYPAQDGLFFHYSNLAPEKMLLSEYLAIHPNSTLNFHLETSNPHCLLQKMVDEGVAVDKDSAFRQCFSAYRNSIGGAEHFERLKEFLIDMCQ